MKFRTKRQNKLASGVVYVPEEELPEELRKARRSYLAAVERHAESVKAASPAALAKAPKSKREDLQLAEIHDEQDQDTAFGYARAPRSCGGFPSVPVRQGGAQVTPAQYSKIRRNIDRATRALRPRLPGVHLATTAQAVRRFTHEAAARHEAGHLLVTALLGGTCFAALLLTMPDGKPDGCAAVVIKNKTQLATFAIAGAAAQGVPWITALDGLALAQATTPQTAARVAATCRRRAEKLLRKHQPALQSLTSALLRTNFLTRPMILRILRRHGISSPRASQESMRQWQMQKPLLLKAIETFRP